MVPFFPFGLKPKDAAISSAIKEARACYDGLPETTCSSRGICCRAGCPNMNLAEFLSMREGCVDRMTKEERQDLTLACLRSYLRKQEPMKPKPCPLLGQDMKCKAYAVRPLRCRTYGLIPKETYEKMVYAVAEQEKISPAWLPLCVQCPLVKVKEEWKEKFPDGRVPEGMIVEREARLKGNDLKLGVPEEKQKKGFSYLAYHDWHVMSELGEDWMSTLSEIRLRGSDTTKEEIVKALKKALAGSEKE